MTEFFIEREKKPDLKDAVLLEGLPGIGNVARLAVDFMINQTNAKKYVTVYSDCFPKSAFIDEDSLVSLPKVEIYYKKREGKRDLILLTGDIQPQNSKDNYALMRKILELTEELGVNEIITLGGIGISNPTPEKVHGAASSEGVIKKFKKHEIIFDGNGTVNLVVGAAGLLIGLAKLQGTKGISLLSETTAKPGKIGTESSKALLKILEKYLDMDLKLDELEVEMDLGIKKRGKGKGLKELKKMLKRYSEKEDLSYIG